MSAKARKMVAARARLLKWSNASHTRLVSLDFGSIGRFIRASALMGQGQAQPLQCFRHELARIWD
jgi:hypothetical protein